LHRTSTTTLNLARRVAFKAIFNLEAEKFADVGTMQLGLVALKQLKHVTIVLEHILSSSQVKKLIAGTEKPKKKPAASTSKTRGDHDQQVA
jgi:hypothetical protein